MVATGWWIARGLTGSLERLTTHVEAVRDGRVSSPPVSRATEIAALAQAFEEMRAALEGKNYVEHYTQALTHELKSPLAAIRGAAELLHENMAPEQRARFLAHLRAESDRIQKIVDKMLHLAALESRRSLEAIETIDLGAVAREATEMLRPAWTARTQDVQVEAADGVMVRGERFLLVQAAVNFLQNAIEFTPTGGRIAVRVTGHGAHVELTVEDGGPGVPDYATTQIFERFYSLPRPDTGRKSTGLGLSFVREIALLHHGETSVVNRPGGGACATLRLPTA
jgi:two-component system sensor histidine kinase CreC